MARPNPGNMSSRPRRGLGTKASLHHYNTTFTIKKHHAFVSWATTPVKPAWNKVNIVRPRCLFYDALAGSSPVAASRWAQVTVWNLMMTKPPQNWQLEWSVGEPWHGPLCLHTCSLQSKVHLNTGVCEQWGSQVVACLCDVISFIWAKYGNQRRCNWCRSSCSSVRFHK